MQRKRIPVKPGIRTRGPRPAAPLRSAAQRKHRRRYCDTRRNGADPAGWHTGWRMAWPLAVEIVREADNLQSSPLTLATAAITAAMPPLLGSGHPMAQARTLTLAWTRHRDKEPDRGNCRSQLALRGSSAISCGKRHAMPCHERAEDRGRGCRDHVRVIRAV